MDNIAQQAALKAAYPGLGLSFGYIGDITCGPVRDYRRFYVFTRVKAASGQASEGVFVFAVPADTVGVWSGEITWDTPEVRAGLERLAAMVASGERTIWPAAQ